MIRRHIPIRRHILTSLVLMGLLGVAPDPPAAAVAKPAAEPGKSAETGKNAQVVSAYGKLPLSFIENKGQVDKKVKFYEKGSGHATYFAKDGVYLSLVGSSGSTPNPHCPEHSALPLSQIPPFEKGGKGGFASCATDPSDSRAPANSPQSAVVKLIPLGANRNPKIVAEGLQEGKVNYFVGSDPKKWKTNVPTYRAVVYQEVYAGIDLKFYGNNEQIEYDIVVKPWADPSKVKLAYEGIESLRVTEGGDLEIALNGSTILQKKPLIYQEIDGRRVDVVGTFKIQSNTNRHATRFTYGFQVASYDKAHPLVIDPILVYSTYLGGGNPPANGPDAGNSIAVDGSGNAYVTGVTGATNFPTSSPLQAANNGTLDVFVTKLNTAGSAIVYSTYLGGGGQDNGSGIAVDGSGNAYVTGFTQSGNFPTVNPLQPANGGGAGTDVFVAKLNAAGSALLYSTYLGGSDVDVAGGIAVDGSGNAYVTGSSLSSNLPTTPGAYQASLGSINHSGDAFVAKLNATGSALFYSTYLGGMYDDGAGGIAVDGSGNASVTGYTSSSNFPTASPLQATWGGGTYDAFVAKLNAAGSGLLYSTYLGGSGYDNGAAIAMDGSGNAYVTGRTNSTNFPTASPLQAVYGGGTYDAFVAKLNAVGSALVYSTYLGGSSSDNGAGIVMDGSGNAYVTGGTSSTNFPAASPLQAVYGGGNSDAFVAKLNAAGSALVYSTYLGGGGADGGGGIAVDGSANTYVTGGTSASFPTTPGAFQSGFGGGSSDAFVVKIGGSPAELPRTGQTTCYDSAGAVIPCTGTGQDGEIQAGVPWPNPRFTDNGNGTVNDNLTGLMWTQDGNAPGPVACSPGTTKTWQGALDYVACLNTNAYLGYNDWHLPNILEIESLINAGQSSTAAWLNTQGFSNVSDYIYWSSTTDVAPNNPSSAWLVYVGDGFMSGGGKSAGNYHVWPVRSGQPTVAQLWETGQTTCYDSVDNPIACTGTGQDGDIQAGVSWPSPRFTISTDGYCVTDNLTSLMWVRSPSADNVTTTWQQALDVANGLSLCGYTDWRLPDRKELVSLLDFSQYDPTLPSGHPFLNVQPNYYWSSTTLARDLGLAWFVNMWYGGTGGNDKSNNTNTYVWPVRSGQVGQTFTLSVSKTGTGGGTVTSSPAGISCGATCSASFDTSTVGTLTATPDATSTFVGWGGDCTGTGSCTVTMDGGKSVTATFTRIQYALSVSKTGTGGGTVTSSPAGINCDPVCSGWFDANTDVTLSAVPDGTATFTGWSGGCTGTGTCNVTMDGDRTVTATFTAGPTSNTPVGSPVTVTLGNVTVTFSTVTVAGETAATPSGTGPPPPSGFRLGMPPTYYEITTTAIFSGTVSVCITYLDSDYRREQALALFHRGGTGWQNVTTTLDTTANVICGVTTTLSPFVVVEPDISPLINISSRARVLTGNDVLIGGFIISGTTPKTVLLRARGPSMGGAPFNIPGVLANPTMQLYSGATVIAQNNDWQTTDPLCGSPATACGDATQISATAMDPCQPNPGQTVAPPGCAQESALLVTLPPGGYTTIVSGVGGGTGVGLVEVFAADTITTARLINISSRSRVETGNNVLIGGLIIGGTTSKTVLLRARGPSMGGAPFNIPGVLANPTMQLYSGATVIAQNDNWQTTDPLCGAPATACGDAAQISATAMDPCQPNPGQSVAPPNCSQEAAVLVTLPPGGYTTIVSGVGGGVGVGLVEVFEVP